MISATFFLNIWQFLNEPLSVLFIGSAIGWVFINLVWEPRRAKIRDLALREVYRKEVLLRISELNQYFSPEWSGVPVDNLIWGFKSMNPALKEWEMKSLIYFGWNEEAYRKSIKYISELHELKYQSEKLLDNDRLSRAKQVLYELAIYLNKLQK